MRPEAEAPLVAADEVRMILRHAAVVHHLLAARVAHALDGQLVDGGRGYTADSRRRLREYPCEGLVTREFHAGCASFPFSQQLGGNIPGPVSSGRGGRCPGRGD